MNDIIEQQDNCASLWFEIIGNTNERIKPEEETKSICGLAVCGLAILGDTVGKDIDK